MFKSKEAQNWHLQGDDKLAYKSQEKCLNARGFIPKCKNQDITDARLFAYSPDTQKVRIRVDCDYRPFWLEISFFLNETSLNFEAYGHIDDMLSNVSTKIEAPRIINISDDGFTLNVKCQQIPSFWIDIDVPFKKLTSFIKENS
jgi:hypothetical protein